MVFDSRATGNCTSGLTSAVTGLTVYVDHTYPYQLGDVSGATLTPLSIPGGDIFIGRDTGGTGSGAPFVYIAGTGTNAMTASVVATAPTSAITGLPPVVLEGTNLSVNATGGSIGVAPIAATTTTATVINASRPSNGNQPTVLIGEGVTVGTVTASGSIVTSLSSNTMASLTVSNAAQYTSYGSGAHTTVTIGQNSTCNYWGSGNITTLNNAGVFDRTGDTRAITISSLVAEAGSTFYLDNGKPSSITRSSITLSNCGMQQLTLSTPLGERF